jgi:2-desacetyl-2-hydroxyethyl bacteriochlorophyllide A dehydrogenase
VQRQSLVFKGPRQVVLRTEALAPPRASQLLVKTELSAISAGTEMLLYRGQIPADSEAQGDMLSSQLRYPTTYGYAAVGRVVEVGPEADPQWRDRLVFAFRPHSSHFLVSLEEVLPLPNGLGVDDGAFLPNMETAVNLVLDTAPLLGENVLVLGQGVVGLLTAALLHAYPLGSLVTADLFPARRQASEELGIADVLDPGGSSFKDDALKRTGPTRRGYDAALELTGNPSALNTAIELTAFSGRVIVGSWYGSKTAPVGLGNRYHRSRIAIVASQVSSIAPQLSGRWDKQRRFDVAWSQLGRIRPSRWITHRFPIGDAAEAYRLLDESPQTAIQAVFTYS